MKSTRVKLTQSVVERAQWPSYEVKQEFLRDTEIKGFGLRVISAQLKSFIWEGWVNGRSRRMTIGQWPAMSVAAARLRAQKIRTQVGDGLDPMIERRKEAAACDAKRRAERDAPTFAQLVDAYFERHARPNKSPRSIKDDTWLLAKYVPESWNKRKIKDITPEDVDRLHKKIGAEHGRCGANQTVRLLRAMFNLAKRREWKMLPADTDNPAAGMKLFDEEPRTRFLRPDELRRLNKRLMSAAPVWQAYFPLAAFLGLRRNELASLRWSKVDFEAGVIEILDTKNSHPLFLPIPSPAAAILRKLAAERKDGNEWVFPSATSACGHIVEPSKAWQNIRVDAGVSDVRIHDLRHTLASWMVGVGGQNLPVVGKALNHRNMETTQRYAHLDLGPVRQALEHTTLLMTAAMAAPAKAAD